METLTSTLVNVSTTLLVGFMIMYHNKTQTQLILNEFEELSTEDDTQSTF